MKFSSAAPFRLPGITSHLVNGRSAAELPISRQSCTQAIAAFRSSGWDIMLVSIWTGSRGLGPVNRILPRLSGRTMPANIDQEPAVGLNPVNISALANGTLTWLSCMLGGAGLGPAYLNNVAAVEL